MERFNIAPSGEARFGYGLWVSGDFFPVLGVEPVLGRLFTAADDRRGCGVPGAVISYAFWRREFGGEASALGHKVWINAHPVEVIGVTPPSFFVSTSARSSISRFPSARKRHCVAPTATWTMAPPGGSP